MLDATESDKVFPTREAPTVKKHWTKIAIALGPVIMIASVVWEYARTNPSYNFLVEPWAIRGYETDHMWVYIVAAVLVLIGGLATSWDGALRNGAAAVITTYFVIAATFFTVVFGAEDLTISITTVMNIVISFIIASAFSLALRSLLGDRSRVFARALPIGLPVFVFFVAVFHFSIVGKDVTVRPWVVVFIIYLLLGGLAIAIKPLNMSANRMLIAASINLWLLVLLSAGSLRETLIRIQSDTVQSSGATGISAQYKDTQAALGWWIAGLGTTVVFVGAVGLWAKRRDIVAAIARARRQRAAAEKSAKEIEEAAAAYALELEQQAATPPQ